MSIIQSFILGIVQGLTEFLPVSSSGHLVIAQKLMGLASEDLTISIVAHFGTLLAILYFYRQEFLYILGGIFDTKTPLLVNPCLRLVFLVLVAILPAAVVGLLLQDFLKTFFGSTDWVGGFLIVTAIILLLTKLKSDNYDYSENYIRSLPHQMSFVQALLIGVAQALAICPGISRSGSTIAAGLFLGLKRDQAAFFSFLISVPVIFGAMLLEIKELTHIPIESLLTLFVVFITSLIFGVMGLLGITTILNRGKMPLFAMYLIPVGIFVIIYL